MASVTRTQLDRPVQETARLLALAWLADADAALTRLSDAENTEALHDFRVSLRRFRSCVRAYQPYLKGSAPKKARRRMGAVASGTNAGRDAEVQIAWLESQRERLTPGELVGWGWLVAQAEKRCTAAYAQARQGIAGAYRSARRDVEERFSSAGGQLEALSSEPQQPTFVQVTGELIREHAGELRDLLAKIRTSQDEAEAHAARIAAKRLRYLLEPLSKPLAGVKPLIKKLKELQDILGELHDAHVMRAEIAAAIEVVTAEQAHRQAEGRLPGLRALTQLCGERRDRLFLALSDLWLDGSALGFFAQASEWVGDLIGQAETD